MSINPARMLFSLFLATSSAAFAVPAAAFTFQDDPSSTWGGDSSIPHTFVGNTITYQNLYAQNLTANSLPGLSFAIPFIWPLAESGAIPMQWRNDLNGWYTNDFNNMGTSLTVSLTAPASSSVAMSEIADLTGSQQLPLTEPCQSGSPSCTPAPYPSETRNLDDRIPVIALGAFAPNETKNFDVSFTYTFGDQRTGALRTAFIANTVSAIAPIPEPETYALFLAGLGLLSLMIGRHRLAS
ncbi:PEP-CTERM sorting domain-containing protein [Nitrosovibrio tenuis]|uniref:PEP-CTERM protein-sorting domain-containing protein n=1 Tax=Nitrosovibrio tenuis TaxID=1233 RepID=A0A1H7K2M5_9PROT|nr:PEP-CTERM sorting domain-containing protein [Nitrosovibrio tenuis]SEK81113.1 PEP-CTERM protein-sorting domain-containing protein [Nitrosovibrio tenuis]